MDTIGLPYDLASEVSKQLSHFLLVKESLRPVQIQEEESQRICGHL